MAEESIDETKNYFIEEIKQNKLMSKKHKKVCNILNYIEHLLILDFTVRLQELFPFLLLLFWFVFL